MVLAARVATWTAARQNVFSPGGSRPTWTAARQNVFSPGGLRRDVDQITAAVIWGSLAESVCRRVGLTVAPESGAYTVACIDLLTFQGELRTTFTFNAATP